MITAARITLWYLAALAIAACVAWSASGQTYDPATSGPLHSWVAANGKPGAVLTIPAGTYDLTAPIFVSGFTLAGADPLRPTILRPRGHGLVWVGQPRWTYDLPAYKQGLTLCTKPPGAPPATFDATETPLSRPLHRARKLSITLDLDTPGGTVEPGGLFNFGPLWCWWHPGAPRGPEILLQLGDKPFDPAAPRPVKLTWERPAPAERLTLIWSIDLDAGTVDLVVNGVGLGVKTIPAGKSFPAICNVRATLGGAQQEANEIRGRWMLPDGIPDRKIRGFSVVEGANNVLARLAINSEWLLSVSSPEGSGPLYPVPRDPEIYKWVGGTTRLVNLTIRPAERTKAGVRVGQVMGQARFENVGVEGGSVAVRKLPGLVSYTHYFDRFRVEYCDGAMLGHGMIVHGRDWDIRYPRLFGVSLADSNFRLERWNGTAGCEDKAGADIQVVFDFAAASAGGSVSLAGGMWNDESGRVAMGAFLHYLGGSRDTSNARLLVEDCAINSAGFGRPTYWLRSMPAARPAAARIFASHWGAPLFDVAPNWTVEGPERPAAPAIPAPVQP